MKQYLNSDQTAKLIELGFEKPKNTQYIQRAKARNLHSPFIEFGEPEFEGSYSIGELIEMLPEKITIDGWNYSRVISENEICYYFWELEVYFCICDINIQLIDNLFDAIVRLKEEGVI